MARFSSKLAILGLGSFSLMSAAYADDFTVAGNTLYDFACGEDNSQYTITLRNGSGVDQTISAIIQVSPVNDTLDPTLTDIASTTCIGNLPNSASCDIVVDLKPTVLDIDTFCDDTTEDTILDRTIEVTYAPTSMHSGVVDASTYDFHLLATMTPLGHSRHFSLLTGTLNASDYPTVNHNVGAPTALTGAINYQDGAHRVTVAPELNAAFRGAKRFLDSSIHKVTDYGCNQLPNQLNEFTGPLYTGLYCFGDEDATGVSIRNELVFSGPGPFLFVMPEDADLLVLNGTTFTTENGASPDDIYWVFPNAAGNITVESGVTLPGKIITKGNFTSENTKDVGALNNSWINGAVLSTGNTTTFDVNGTAVIEEDCE